MRVARFYTFELEFVKPALMPVWKGNMIRGTLGLHLKRLYCFRDSKCLECPSIFNCPYGYLFRTKSKGIVLKNLEHFTKPYVIKPPLESKTKYKKGDMLKFSIVLFGDAVEYEMHVINAINSMCKNGLGFKENRGELRLRKVLVENIFKNEKEYLYEDGKFLNSKIFIKDRDIKVRTNRVFKIKFLTPFRLLREGSLIAEPSFKDLTVFTLRRYSSIRYQYAKDELDINVEKTLKLSERVTIISSNLKRRTFIYKAKNEDFIYGELTYSGKLKSPLNKIIAFGQLCHVGKRASYGHGWFIVS